MSKRSKNITHPPHGANTKLYWRRPLDLARGVIGDGLLDQFPRQLADIRPPAKRTASPVAGVVGIVLGVAGVDDPRTAVLDLQPHVNPVILIVVERLLATAARAGRPQVVLNVRQA